MSSHHFVREGQEPALLILDDSFDDALKDLLEWAPFIAATWKTASLLMEQGTKVDLVIASEPVDVKALEVELQHQAPIEIVVHQAARSVVSVGLTSLTERGQSAVNVIARPTSDLFEESQEFAGRVAVSILSARQKWSLIERAVFEKWYPYDTVIAIRPIFPGQMLDYQGIMAVGNEFRVADSQQVRISSGQFFWVREPY